MRKMRLCFSVRRLGRPGLPIVLSLLMLAAWSGVVRAGGGFLETINDIPLPKGFVELRERAVRFEKPGGRIVAAYARGTGSVDEVKKFYRAALPQLGWRVMQGGLFQREDERLRIGYASAGAIVTIEFVLRPAD